ncbi:hypothetical protein BTUL_0121g00250 [Botrytis tulipae]|uniref:Uncharacterized protein n=1 Tax=Botrytis tulipae TaxID=87230 RepID=A0A4Z1EJG0_9HELO|nr:hypothetical protein BTUL_0121g00250 [Botrytis tulipae]
MAIYNSFNGPKDSHEFNISALTDGHDETRSKIGNENKQIKMIHQQIGDLFSGNKGGLYEECENGFDSDLTINLQV